MSQPGTLVFRRGRTVAIVTVAIVALLVWYVGYTRQIIKQLKIAAATQASMYDVTIRQVEHRSVDVVRADVYINLLRIVKKAGIRISAADSVAAIVDTVNFPNFDAVPVAAYIRLLEKVNESRVPLVKTDAAGTVIDTVNIPANAPRDSVGNPTKEFIQSLDRANPPIVNPDFGTEIHIGDSSLVRGLRFIPTLQAGSIILLLAIAIYALLERGRADREKVWAGMAREAAHQLGTPLSAISGWLELLEDRDGDATSKRAIAAMQQDLTRLNRVSHRFERIGRDPRRDEVDAAALVERLADYFAARAPTLAKQVQIVSERPSEPLIVHGDGVLLEWVLEVLIKNAIDALGGRNGKVTVSATPLPEGGARVRVADDGPGVPRDLRKRIFDAGFSTKQAGWGIGLSLARRIVEENHGGNLVLVDTDTGAVFDVILHA